MGQWRRWGEATPALGVLEALFRILPRRCRPTLARVGLQGGARAHQEQPVDGAQGRSASGCRAWAHRATGRSYHASRNSLIRAVTVTVTFRGSNITGRGSNRPVTPTPDPARPGGVGEHQRRAALRPPASSRPPNIGQMRVLNQVRSKCVRVSGDKRAPLRYLPHRADPTYGEHSSHLTTTATASPARGRCAGRRGRARSLRGSRRAYRRRRPPRR